MVDRDNVTPLDSRRDRLPAFRTSPTCPQCGALVGRKGHTCTSRADRPNWVESDRILTDPAAIQEHIDAVRAELAAHRPPAPAPAAREDVLRARPLT